MKLLSVCNERGQGRRRGRTEVRVYEIALMQDWSLNVLNAFRNDRLLVILPGQHPGRYHGMVLGQSETIRHFNFNISRSHADECIYSNHYLIRILIAKDVCRLRCAMLQFVLLSVVCIRLCGESSPLPRFSAAAAGVPTSLVGSILGIFSSSSTSLSAYSAVSEIFFSSPAQTKPKP